MAAADERSFPAYRRQLRWSGLFGQARV